MWRLLADFGKHANPYKNPLLSSSIAFLVAFASALVEDVVYRRADPWGNPAVWVSLVTAAVLLPTWILSTDRVKTLEGPHGERGNAITDIIRKSFMITLPFD